MKTSLADTVLGAFQGSCDAVNMPSDVGRVASAVAGPHGYLLRHGTGVRDTVSEAVLDIFPIGIIVVNACRQVIRLNQWAIDMLQKSADMALCDGRLVLMAFESNQQLAAIISDACQRSIGSEFSVAPAGPAIPALHLRIVPLSAGSELATVFISTGDWRQVPALGDAKFPASPIFLHQVLSPAPTAEKPSLEIAS